MGGCCLHESVVVQEEGKTCSAFESHNMLFHKTVTKVSVYTKTTLTVKMYALFLSCCNSTCCLLSGYIYLHVYLNRKVNNILSISIHGSWIAHSFNKTAVKFCPVFAGGCDKKHWGFIVSARVFVQDSSRCSSTLQNERVGPFFTL